MACGWLSWPPWLIRTWSCRPSPVPGYAAAPQSAGFSFLQDYLQPKHLLLVLDNCEHLVEACAQLADALLQACPQLVILATSRETLGVAGETFYRVPPLPFPECGNCLPGEAG